MPKKIISWSCSYCNKFTQSKKEHTIKHESLCFFNPKNKACFTCKFSKRRLRKGEERKLYFGFVWECKKKNITFFNKGYQPKHTINIDTITGKILKELKQLPFNIFEEHEKLLFPTSNCDEYKFKN